jgi:hypothetical protein
VEKLPVGGRTGVPGRLSGLRFFALSKSIFVIESIR